MVGSFFDGMDFEGAARFRKMVQHFGALQFGVVCGGGSKWFIFWVFVAIDKQGVFYVEFGFLLHVFRCRAGVGRCPFF
jgi:hypothetical protein